MKLQPLKFFMFDNFEFNDVNLKHERILKILMRLTELVR